MITNVGVIDRVFRFGLGLGLLIWSDGYFGSIASGNLVWVAYAAGAALTFSGLFRFCPVYAALRTHSCANDISQP